MWWIQYFEVVPTRELAMERSAGAAVSRLGRSEGPVQRVDSPEEAAEAGSAGPRRSSSTVWILS